MTWIYLLLILLLILLITSYQLGSFRKPLIEKSTMPGYQLMGIPYQGSYQKIGPSIKKIAEIARKNGWPPEIIAVYFDNPKEVKDTECRALAAIRVNSAQQYMLKNEKLDFLQIPAGTAAVCHWKGKSLPTRIMGAIRVYPHLQQFMAQKHLLDHVQYVYEVYEKTETIFVMQYNEK